MGKKYNIQGELGEGLALLLVFVCLFVCDKICLCSPRWPGTYYLVQDGFELRDAHASASQVLRLQTFVTMLSLSKNFKYQINSGKLYETDKQHYTNAMRTQAYIRFEFICLT